VFSFKSFEQEPEEGFSVKVYPNPGSVVVNFKIDNNLNSEEELHLIIYDSSGKLIISRTIKNYESFITLQTDNWASGLYTYQIKSNNETLKTDGFEIIRLGFNCFFDFIIYRSIFSN